MTQPISWHNKPINQVISDLDTTKKGISSKEAKQRLKRYGPNKLKEEKGPGPLSIFFNQFSGFLIRILIGATIVSFFIGEVVNAIAIIIIIIISAILGFFQEFKAEKTMEALRKMTAHEAIVMRDGEEVKIHSSEIVPGDVVIIEEGSKIPADMRIIQEIELKVDESCLTGESTPVTKTNSIVSSKNLAEMKSMLWSGTTSTYGRAIGVVTATGMNTQIGRIANIVQKTGEELTPLQKRLDLFGKKLGILILGICASVSVLGLIRLGPLSGAPITSELIILMATTGIALAVAAIPEGLVAVVTTTLALGVRRLSKNNALMRKLPAVETLGSTTVICSDKTGTLTKNEMTITQIWHSGKIINVSGTGYSPKGGFAYKDKMVHTSTDSTLLSILRSGSLCNNARLLKDENVWSIIGDPTEGSIIVAARKGGINPKNLSNHERLKEFPFSSDRMMMSVVTKSDSSILHSKGAPEKILSLCSHIMVNGKRKKLTSKDKKVILDANQKMTSSALRVLAVANKKLSGNGAVKENDLTFLGLVGMIDPPSEGVKQDIKLCHDAGIKVVMITGDHVNTATAIAEQLEIGKGKTNALTGEELDSMNDSELRDVVQNVSVYARVSPEHKVRIVNALKKKGHIIAMTGDGVNDAPALKSADIGVAMGIKGTDVSKEASDMILRDDNFSSIVMAVKEGRGIYDNIKKFIQYLLSSNVGEVLIVFLAILIGFTDPTGAVVIPLTAIQLLWVNLLTDGLPALALGVDPPAPNIMKRLPRNPRENILSKPVLTEIFFVGVLITIGTLFLFWMNLTQGAAIAISVAFTSIVVFEMVRVQAVRIKYKIGFFSNKKLLLAMATSLLLQLFVLYGPLFHPSLSWIHTIFDTTFLGVMEWVEILAVSGILMILMWLKEKFFGTAI